MNQPDDRSAEVVLQVVDYVLPVLKPYEFSVYVLLLRRCFLEDGSQQVRIGKRSIAAALGKGTRSSSGNYQHISEVLAGLEEGGFIVAGDTTREGTTYIVRLPVEVPKVAERMPKQAGNAMVDYFNSPEGRREVFERDEWTCQYCGELLTPDAATLDHYIPQCDGGQHSKENLKTCCFMCNSIKSGKSFEQAAPLLLKSIHARRMKTQKAAADKLT